MNRAVTDTSFLSHALIPSQKTAEAEKAFDEALTAGRELFVSGPILVEFFSVLRKLVMRGNLAIIDANDIRRALSRSVTGVWPATEHDAQSAFVLATRLGQSDIFDTTGYVIAQRNDAEFWVSDRRFANASTAAQLSGVVLHL